MWYKYIEETNEWLSGNEIHLPSGTILKDDHSIEQDGWFWSDNEPKDYTLWIAKLQEFKP